MLSQRGYEIERSPSIWRSFQRGKFIFVFLDFGGFLEGPSLTGEFS